MKKALHRIASSLTAALLVLGLLSSCASGGKAALRYGKSGVSAGLYQYFASSYKGIYAYSYTDYADKASFWQKELAEGLTVLDYLNGQVLSNVKRTLVCVELFDQLGLRLSDSDYESIDDAIDKLEEDYAGGSRNAFNKLLSAYGINRTMLREARVMETKVTRLESALFADGGLLALTDEDRETFYQKTYSHVQLIFINDDYRYETDEEGKYTYDSATGGYATRALTEAEAKAEEAKIAAAEAALAGGSSFAEVMAAYSEAADYYGEGVYPNGFYFTASTPFLTDVVEAAFDMAVGEVRCVKTQEDGTFFLLREAPDPGAWDESDNSDFFSDFETLVKSDRFYAYLSDKLSDVTVDDAVVAACSLDLITANYRY